MQVKEIMTPDVELTKPDITISEVARKMRTANIGALPVGKDDRLIGMITDRDIVMRAIAEDKVCNTTAAQDVMSEKVIYCFDKDDVQEAAKIMAQNQVRRLPVLNQDKRLVGIISLADISLKSGDAAETALEGISQPTKPRQAA